MNFNICMNSIKFTVQNTTMKTEYTSRSIIFSIFFLLSCFHVKHSYASHILGGGFYYRFIDSASGIFHYKITMVLYQDCHSGVPDALIQDNPAFWGIYQTGNTTPFIKDSTVWLTSQTHLVLDFGETCVYTDSIDNIACVQKSVFEKDLFLPPSPTGYTISYQRCCRSKEVLNFIEPDQIGITNFCLIPPGIPTNSSAVFAGDPPFASCINQRRRYWMNAVDIDGDSLSYTFDTCYIGSTAADIKPWPPLPLPYSMAPYITGFDVNHPLGFSSEAAYLADSGLIILNPDTTGIFVIGVACHEWRAGSLINTTRMEFNLLSIDCSTVKINGIATTDTIIQVGDTIHINASTATVNSWSPAAYLSDSSINNPTAVFPSPGYFTYILTQRNAMGCEVKDTINITVVDRIPPAIVIPNAFTPNGDLINDLLLPLKVNNAIFKEFIVIDGTGRRVFQTQSLGSGWDGRINGTPAKEGVYFCQLTYIDARGEEKRTNGNVTLLR